MRYAFGIGEGCADTTYRPAIQHNRHYTNPARVASSIYPDMIFGKDRCTEMLVPERQIGLRGQCGKEALAPGLEVILGNQTEQHLMSRPSLFKRH